MEPNLNDNSNGNLGENPFSSLFTGEIDIAQMSEAPTRGGHHRRAQSESMFLDFSDDEDMFLLDSDFDFDLTGIDMSAEGNNDVATGGGLPAVMVDSPAVTTGESPSNGGESNKGKGKVAGSSSSHLRSLSVGAEFFEGLGFEPSAVGGNGGGGDQGELSGGGAQETRVHRHRSSSVDGSSSSFEGEPFEYARNRATGEERLRELARIDPKRAQRILSNRQSAARSKERKLRYAGELERKIKTLKIEATSLSAQVTLLQRDSSRICTDNKELKFRVQALEQQAHLRDALKETLNNDIRRLQLAIGQGQSIHGNSFNGELPQSQSSVHPPQFFAQPQPSGQYANPQLQQELLRMPQSSSNHQGFGSQSSGHPPQFVAQPQPSSQYANPQLQQELLCMPQSSSNHQGFGSQSSGHPPQFVAQPQPSSQYANPQLQQELLRMPQSSSNHQGFGSQSSGHPPQPQPSSQYANHQLQQELLHMPQSSSNHQGFGSQSSGHPPQFVAQPQPSGQYANPQLQQEILCMPQSSSNHQEFGSQSSGHPPQFFAQPQPSGQYANSQLQQELLRMPQSSSNHQGFGSQSQQGHVDFHLRAQAQQQVLHMPQSTSNNQGLGLQRQHGNGKFHQRA